MSNQTHDFYIQPKLKQIPAHLISVADYKNEAQRFMPETVWAQISGGAGEERTLAKNCKRFDNLEILPRVLSNFNQADTSVSLLGRAHPVPFLLAPIAHQKLLHPDGELAAVSGADALGIGSIVSTLSSITLEDVAKNSSSDPWFQLYFQTEKKITLDLVQRAEASGYEAIVVTVDAPITGLRNRVQRSGFRMPDFVTSANLAAYPVPPARTLTESQSIILHGFMAEAPTWEDLIWLQQHTDLPILLKGILSPHDAVMAKKIGLSGVIVSNHGGRTLDGVPASIDCVSAIRSAVGPDYLLLLDSGIRRGSDSFKALALGADAVLIGRPFLYGLAVAGSLGVAHVLKLLKEELEITMALSGHQTIASIKKDALC
ncbi:alpha-hydroxy acid oxidase [Teredinibacter haidensis]|uniref:alpha-hydroxy acid oxidase n=1 Tax=Teredinibacter haidensis TaxID=2731755 RepID=UPI000948D097|nr:alpha-hydroxy acid oxidase [Teredinibacter haidensis]